VNEIRPCSLGCRNAEGVPYRAAPGLLVCHPCSDRLRTVLDHIETTYTTVTDINELIPGGHGPGGVRRPPGPRSPAVDSILVHTDPRSAWDEQPAALATVESWARMVRGELGAAVPEGRVTIGRELELLRRRWDWIMYQAWIVDFAQEMRAVLTALHMVSRQQDKVLRVGKCPIIVAVLELPTGGRVELECGASLRLRPGRDEIRCTNCGEVWPRSRWHEIGDPWADYASLAHLWEMPPATLRWWARDDHWRSVKLGRRVVILRADALRSYVRRRGQLPLGVAG
jgi:hypothetical protein